MVMLLGEKVIYFYMVAGTSRAWNRFALASTQPVKCLQWTSGKLQQSCKCRCDQSGDTLAKSFGNVESCIGGPVRQKKH